VFGAESTVQVKPVFPVVAHIYVPGMRLKNTTAGLRISPRCIIELFSAGYSHKLRHVAFIGLLLFVRCGLATSIVVRRDDKDGSIAIAADSKRGTGIPLGNGERKRIGSIQVCKICQVDRGIFVSAGLADIDWCKMAQGISKQLPTVKERSGQFAAAAETAILSYLSNAIPNIIVDTTSGKDIVQTAFVSTEGGVTKYAVVVIAAVPTQPGMFRRTIEVCPQECRPYFVLGSESAETYIDTDRVSLMRVPAIDFVRKVVREAIRRDPERVSAPIDSVVVGHFGAQTVDRGKCPE
jgi:hypothetical protein